MKSAEEYSGRFRNLYQRLRSIRVPYKVIFFILGIASTVWFLIRVIPKPSRAGYPCIKAAAPFMSSFVIYLLSITGSAMLFKRSGQFFRRTRYLMATGAFAGALVLFVFSSNILPDKAVAADQLADPSDFPANQPMGEERGIFPGRVVWEWDPDATNENCTNDFEGPDGKPDGYFLAKNNDQAVIDRMLDDIVKKLTGTYDVALGWDLLFKDFNQRKGREPAGYQPGEKIFIKINQGGAGWLTTSDSLAYGTGWQANRYPNVETSGPMAVAVLKHLVEDYGVRQEDIYIGDPIAHILKDNYDQMVALFPDVIYVDKDDYAHLGRTRITKTSEEVLKWSAPDELESDLGDTRKSYNEVMDADYLINVATLKAHARAGVTLTAKNHFGTHANNGATPLHPGLVSKDNYNPYRTDYGMYRVLTDIMGHDKLGGNTVLFIVEGLWGGPEAVSTPVKWQMHPFNNDWPSSILASQDAVALESVCYDILRTEFDDPGDPAQGSPMWGAVDDHLHQAADSDNWPEGFVYDPEGDGTPMGSMGVHEHWNNAVDRQYSRNLGFDYGIELIAPKELVEQGIAARETGQAPVFDGDPSDACWNEANWYTIDQTWIPWGAEVDSADFFGRFKVSWSGSENLLYFLIEVTDDQFIDGYTYPDGGYHNYDIPEVFIDEDASGGLHALDDDPKWGMNSENAFSYHINVDAPADGQTTSDFVAMDLDGGWTRINYAGHFPDLAMKKEGNKYFYEFSLKVYDDTYDHANPESSRVQLATNKLMGLSLAWCDNDEDSGEIERDNFFGSVWVTEEAYNDHWMNSDDYGRVRLVRGSASVNQAVEVTGSIADFTVMEMNKEVTVHSDLSTVFTDPDGDILTYTVSCDEPVLEFSTEGSVLTVTASDDFGGSPDVTVAASDGQYEAQVTFKISADINQAVEVTGVIADFEVTELETDLVVHDDLSTVFSDPDGDPLTYSVASGQSELSFSIEGQMLSVRATASFSGEATVTVTATDGEFEAQAGFKVTASITGVHDGSAGEVLTCYPNPFIDLVQLEVALPAGISTEAVARVYDMSGALVLTRNLGYLNGGRGSATIDLGFQPRGYYILKLEAGGETLSRILNKQ